METSAAQPDAFEPDTEAARAAIGRALAARRRWLDARKSQPSSPPTVFRWSRAGSSPIADCGQRMLQRRSAGRSRSRSVARSHAQDDVGGVALNLGSPERVRGAARAMLDRIRTARPEPMIDGFLVQDDGNGRARSS